MAQKQDRNRNGTTATIWNAIVDFRAPSPAPRPAKRNRQLTEGCSQYGSESIATPQAPQGEVLLDNALFNEMLDDGWLRQRIVQQYGSSINADAVASKDLSAAFPSVNNHRSGKGKMRTGCIPCLMKGRPCDWRNPQCKRATSDAWSLNDARDGEVDDEREAYPTPEALVLSAYRPDMKWRRSWRERHSLNFFALFSAPQMSGFFESIFWQRMVIQMSFHEGAILHAITAIGALHEALMQRAFADEKRRVQAMEFALNQCNRAISSLTGSRKRGRRGVKPPDSRLALTTCVLFTCFEAMQGRCDSAVNHALQGRRLLHAMGRPNVTSMSPSTDDDLEQMRPLVERLEVQATALLDKGKRPDVNFSDQTAPLPPIEYVFTLEHAHNTLHTALNSVMRFMQGFHPIASREHIAASMAEKFLRYGPWFTTWEQAFTKFLSNQRACMSDMDLKRAMVLKANHLVGTMLASVDQSAGPVAYDAYEAEFKAIVDLSREVLASFSCPPLPTLSGGTSGTPYLSFSLWVTDPLWMAISRCRNPSIRQAAFTLLSQNPRQEGIWHAGPNLTNNRYTRKAETAPKIDATKSEKSASGSPAEKQESPSWAGSTKRDMSDDDTDEEPRQEVVKAHALGNMKQRGEWVDSRIPSHASAKG